MEDLDFDLIKPGVSLGETSHYSEYKCKYNNNYICSFKKFKSKNIPVELTKQIAGCINSELKRLKTNINLVQFIGTCFDEFNQLHLVTEFVVGVTLADFIRKEGDAISWPQKANIIFQLSQGLEFLHVNNFVHRNLHSSSILLDYDDVYCPKISDVSLHEIHDTIDEYNKVTRSRDEFYWKAPEITTLSFSSGSKKADIYAFGLVMWEMALGGDVRSHIEKILQGDLEDSIGCVDEDYRNALTSALSIPPENRPNAQELTLSLHVYADEVLSDFSEEDPSNFIPSTCTSVRDSLPQISDQDVASLYEQGLAHYQRGEYTKAAICFDTPAWNGHAQAQFYLGKFHLFGIGRERNLMLATRWLEGATNLGNLDAEFLLARTFYFGVRESGRIDKDEAAYIYQKLSKKSHLESKLALAYCLEIGEGIDPNPSRAIALYQKLADAGNAMAVYRLGRMHELGIGTKQDHSKAIELYTIGSEMKHTHSLFRLGQCYELGQGVARDSAIAFQLYHTSAEAGNRLAMQQLALCYERGLGISQSFASSLVWMTRAAERGILKAQLSLGSLYDKGHRVAQDLGKALFWYRKASLGGETCSQNNLGRCYHKGIGVPKDACRAVYWYKKSSESGVSQAQVNLGGCYERGEGVERNGGEAFRLYSLAANQKNSHGYYKLGHCYENGIGVEADVDTAIAYYEKAALVGNDKAKVKLINYSPQYMKPPPRKASFAYGALPLPIGSTKFAPRKNSSPSALYVNRPLPIPESPSLPLSTTPSPSSSYSDASLRAPGSDEARGRPESLLTSLDISMGAGGDSSVSKSIAKRLGKLSAQRFDSSNLEIPRVIPNLAKSGRKPSTSN